MKTRLEGFTSMQIVKALGNVHPQSDAALSQHALVTSHLQTQRVGRVGLHFDLTTCLKIVSKLHHIIIKALPCIAPHLQDRHKTLVATGNGLVALDGLKLALKRIWTIIVVPPYHLHRSQRPRDAPCHPDFTKSTAANETKGLMVSDFRSGTYGRGRHASMEDYTAEQEGCREAKQAQRRCF
jgi:hypothetical protein